MINLSDDFLEQALLHPFNQALFVDDVYYTYSDVLIKVKEIYDTLSKEHQKLHRIGIYCTDDFVTYTSIIAISLYGATFVPINSKFPKEKNEHIIQTSEIEVLLFNIDYKLNFDVRNVKVIGIKNILQNSIAKIVKSDFEPKVELPEAYILFTSGTTGQPKGVAISKKSVISFFDFFKKQKNFNFSDNDRFIQVFELTFDVSIFSFFMPISIGACCYILPQKGIRFLEILKLIKMKKITVATFVPTFLQFAEKYFNQLQLFDLRYTFFIGDKLYQNLTEKWQNVCPNSSIINFYGPTEATIMCSYYNWTKNKADESINGIVPIGKLFDGIHFFLLKESEEDSIGELCLNGNQVIESYLNQTNTDKFIYIKDKLFYKTGDLVSMNENQDFIFHGRIDSQYKINGFRVEISEIEEAVSKFIEGVFVVNCIQNQKGINQLVLFIETNLRKNDNDILVKLKSHLPEYMLPSKIFYLEKIPLNSNGKFDFTQLTKIYLEEINSN